MWMGVDLHAEHMNIWAMVGLNKVAGWLQQKILDYFG